MAQPRIRTRITKLLGCHHPIILPGMSWISTPPLVSAVCRAGGCGILASGPLSPDETRRSIQEVRERNNGNSKLPFGVGVTLMMPGALENAWVAVEEKVPVLSVSLGKPPAELVNSVKSYGGVIMSTVTNAAHASAAVDAGADALMAVGHEAAAHGGDVTTLALVSSLCSSSDIIDKKVPVVAAGGLADGKGLLAALSLGADGVAMGSRLAVTRESPLAEAAKLRLSDPTVTASDTLYGDRFDGIPARVLATAVAKQKMKGPRPFFGTVLYRALKAAADLGVPYWKILAGSVTNYNKIYTIAQFGAATKSLRSATVDGDLDQSGIQFVGQSVGLIRDVPTVEEIVTRIVREAYEQNRINNDQMGLISYLEEKECQGDEVLQQQTN